MNAYTVGNPLGYELALDRGPVEKAPGGIVFETREAAEACLVDGMLPPEWFDDGEPRPGKVYGLLGPVAVERDYYAPGHHRLVEPAVIVRVD